MAINNASQFKPPEVISATATRSFASNDFSKNSFHKFFVEWLNEYVYLKKFKNHDVHLFFLNWYHIFF